MGIFSFLTKSKAHEAAVAKGQAMLPALQKKRDELEATRQQKLQRQVELWSLMELTPEMEQDYKTVSAEIADLITKVAAVDEHIQKLKLAIIHCKEDRCEELNALLAVGDPSESAKYEVPEVSFHKERVGMTS